MYSDIVNVKALEDDWSSAWPTESKSDPFVTEDSLVATTDSKQELSSEGRDEPPLTHNDIELSTWAASTEVDQPRPVRHTGIRDALSHFEQAALSRGSIGGLPIQPQSKDISTFGEEDSPVRGEQSTVITPQREDTGFKDFGPIFHRSPNYRPLSRSRLKPVTGPPVFRRRSPPPAPKQHRLVPSHAERKKEPVPDEIRPARTPTPPYQYASVQRARMIRLMIEKFGPDWVPVEEQSDDDGDGDHEESDSESEEDGMTLAPDDPKNVRQFFDTYLQLRAAARVERGEAPPEDPYPHVSDVRDRENTLSREELIELGVPTVRLVTSKPKPDVPLPFH